MRKYKGFMLRISIKDRSSHVSLIKMVLLHVCMSLIRSLFVSMLPKKLYSIFNTVRFDPMNLYVTRVELHVSDIRLKRTV